MSTNEDYRQAAALLWGDAGDFAATEFVRLNREHFAGSIPPMPIVIGLTAFGRCIGLTRGGGWLDSPRITLAPELFNGNRRTSGGPRMISDTLVHEMVHAALILRGEDPEHNGDPWCRLIAELSPAVLGRETRCPFMPFVHLRARLRVLPSGERGAAAARGRESRDQAGAARSVPTADGTA